MSFRDWKKRPLYPFEYDSYRTAWREGRGVDK